MDSAAPWFLAGMATAVVLILLGMGLLGWLFAGDPDETEPDREAEIFLDLARSLSGVTVTDTGLDTSDVDILEWARRACWKAGDQALARAREAERPAIPRGLPGIPLYDEDRPGEVRRG